MSMKKVAELAGVSLSTVSRVINAHPSISPQTVDAVRAAMERLQFRPSPRRGGERNADEKLAVAYLALGDGVRTTAPAFDRLLGGITEAAEELNVELTFSFVADARQIPSRILDGGVDGLLLSGRRPDAGLQKRLERLPAVWLMGNREQPLWGHQVMPDNTAVGGIAANHLADLGCRHVVALSIANNGWSIKFRALAFEETARERGLQVTLLRATGMPDAAACRPDELATAGEQLVDQLLALSPRPTGLFITEDALAAAVDTAAAARGLDLSPGGTTSVISCNNERPYLAGLTMRPATIDINARAIGRHGLELLVRHVRRPADNRLRLMIGPKFVAAE
jgi:LacI family transcriptional regulator